MSYLVLQDEELQQVVLDKASKSFSDKIGSKTEVDRLEWGFPNSVVLKGVLIEDKGGDTLISVERAKVTLNILPLLRGEISFRTIQFAGMDARISKKDTAAAYNFQFLIDAFSDPNDTTDIKWKMDIESLGFSDCKVSLKTGVRRDTAEIGGLDLTDLGFEDIKGVLFVRRFKRGASELRLHKLHVREKSGLELSNLSATVVADSTEIKIADLITEMPRSRVSVKHATIDARDMLSGGWPNENHHFYAVVNSSHIHAEDIRPIFPNLSYDGEEANIRGAIHGTIDDLRMEGLSVSVGKSIEVVGDFHIEHIATPDNMLIDAHIERASLTAEDARRIGKMVVRRDIYLPDVCDSLGVISYSGEVNGEFKSLTAVGTLETAVGNVFTDVRVTAADAQYNDFRVIGLMDAHGIELDKMFGKKSGLGRLGFDMEVDLKKMGERMFQLDASGKIDTLEYRDYLYQGITLNGKFDENGFNGNFTLSDDNVYMDFEGNIDLRKEQPVFNFMAHITDANLDKLKLIESDEPITVSMDMQAACTGSSLDDIDGMFSLDNFLYHKGGKMFYLNVFTINTQKLHNGDKKINIISDYLNGSLEGKYAISNVVCGLKRMAYGYVPTLEKMDSTYVRDTLCRGNNFKFDFTLENTEPLEDIVTLPFIMQQKCKISGFLNDNREKFSLRVNAPMFYYNDFVVEDALMLVENPKDELKVICRGTYYAEGNRRSPYYLSLGTNAKHDTIDANITLSNNAAVTNGGRISARAILKDCTAEGLTADFLLNPSKIIVKDTVWNIGRGEANLSPRSLRVSDFKMSSGNQTLHAEGVNTKGGDDSIRVWFTDVDLESFSKILASNGVTFAGIGDGDFYITRLFENPTVEGRLGWYDAYLNEYPFGDLNAEFGYDKKNNTLLFGTDLVSAYETHQTSKIDGAVFFYADSLFIDGYLKDVDMRFLRKYLDGVLSENTGVLNTHVHALGKFDNIGLEGIGIVRDFDFTIDYTNTRYTLTDTVVMTQNSFRMNNVRITDKDNNEARLTALILHKCFDDFKYAMNISTDRLMAINTVEDDNAMYYGKVYMSGDVNISGKGTNINVGVNARTERDTKVTIPLDGGAKDVNDNNYITFVRTHKMTQDEKRDIRRARRQKMREEMEAESKAVVNVNVNLEATPEGQITLIMDKKLGDAIRARGTGNLNLKYNSQDDEFKLYGAYQLMKGDYQFTIQSVIARKFELKEGSTVRWDGEATAATLDVDAKYSVNAYVGDILADDNVTTTQTNCLMNVSGTISNPKIKFDLEMPNIDEDMMRKVRSVINTEEAMNRNVASLLAFGTLNTSDVGGTNTNAGNMGFAALSSEISGLLSKINNDLNVGLSYRPYNADQAQSSTEFEVAVSTGLFNDRLKLNGNFGYKEGISALDASTYSSGILDFDAEYAISKNGRFRGKVFNRSSNSYLRQYNSQTQGIGLLYRQDYDTAGELLRSYASPFKNLYQRWKGKKRREDDGEKSKEKE